MIRLKVILYLFIHKYGYCFHIVKWFQVLLFNRIHLGKFNGSKYSGLTGIILFSINPMRDTAREVGMSS